MIYLFENMVYNHSLGSINKDGNEFKLTKIQRKLLKHLLDNPQQVISKQVLMDEVWQRTVTENSIPQRIADLSTVVEEDRSEPKIITTSFGQGFFLNCDVEINNESNKPKPSHHNKSTAFHRSILPLVIISIVFLIGFIYWTQFRVDPSLNKITEQISKEDYMNQFSVDKRQTITAMFANLPKPTRKKFRRFLSHVSDDQKQIITLELLAMSEAERVTYIHSL